MHRRPSVVCCLLISFLALTSCRGEAAAPLPGQIEGVFRAAHEAGEFDGNVLVTRDGRTIYEGSFGLADEGRKTANLATTKFLGFSLMKPMTAVLVFQQVEAGSLALADRLDRFFPELAGTAAGAITIGQLLTHTSGIDDVIGRHQERRITPADLTTAMVKDAGEYQYSSAGYVCLALVLETVTGRPLAELFQEKILVPAQMRDSGLLRSGVPVDDLAVGYRRDKKTRVLAPLGLPPEVLDGAGSLYTTARDLARFDQALREGRLLSPALQARMLEGHDAEHGAGWFLSEQGGKVFPWHQGSFRGFAAVLVRQIHRKEVIAILSNDETTDVLALRAKVLRLLKSAAAARAY